MKKILSLVLVALMVATMCACGTTEPTKAPATNAPTKVGSYYAYSNTDITKKNQGLNIGTYKSEINTTTLSAYDPKKVTAATTSANGVFEAGRYGVLQAADLVLNLRQAVLSPSEKVSLDDAIGRICAAPAVACPPAVPIVISGERITSAHLEVMRYYGYESIEVVK